MCSNDSRTHSGLKEEIKDRDIMWFSSFKMLFLAWSEVSGLSQSNAESPKYWMLWLTSLDLFLCSHLPSGLRKAFWFSPKLTLMLLLGFASNFLILDCWSHPPLLVPCSPSSTRLNLLWLLQLFLEKWQLILYFMNLFLAFYGMD